MERDSLPYDLLAALFTYPVQGYLETLRACKASLDGFEGQSFRFVEQFGERIEGMSIEELQELFTQTFDLNPLCTLDLGWHLYGENYDRGDFLVRLRDELPRYGVAETTELPDHLTHVLALVGRLDPERADTLARSAVIPAIEKMLSALEGKRNPYEQLLKAAYCLVTNRRLQEKVHRG
jgi:nitrate reductase delta subunit